MKPRISVIIPVYNVEKYLDKCIQSVLSQTYENFEAILVDDGSTDSSSDMCDRYAEIDKRVIVYHKPNGGLSDARNFGAERANAEYVSFIDSDDYVSADYLEYLWYLMEKYSADLSIGQFVRVSEKQDHIATEQAEATDYALDTEKAMKQLSLGNDISTVAVGKLYKIDVVLMNKYPYGVYYEDIATTYKLIGSSNVVAVGLKKIYYYLQRDKSILHSTVNDKHMYGLTAAEDMCNYISGRFPNLYSIAHKRCCTTAVDIIIRVFDSENPEKKYYYIARDYLKRHYRIIRHLKEVAFLFKLDCLFYKTGYYTARTYYKMRFLGVKFMKGIGTR